MNSWMQCQTVNWVNWSRFTANFEIWFQAVMMLPIESWKHKFKETGLHVLPPLQFWRVPLVPRVPEANPPGIRNVKRRRFSNRSVALLKGLSNCFRINFLLMGKHLAMRSGRCCWTLTCCCVTNAWMTKNTSLYRFLKASLWWHRKLHSQCCVYIIWIHKQAAKEYQSNTWGISKMTW